MVDFKSLINSYLYFLFNILHIHFRSGKVPNVLFCTVEVPDSLQVTGRGCLVQAHVMKPKRDLRSELNAREISDSLPFLEYELHRLLISKLKVKGMNAIFGLKVQF